MALTFGCIVVEDCYRKELEFKDSKVMLEIIDTAGMAHT
jgi:hypothetical protein